MIRAAARYVRKRLGSPYVNGAAVLSFGSIVLVNTLFFFPHYLELRIFPWDFLSAGYHAQTVAWYSDGSILNPPAWLPYGSMGFPAWLSLQSGAWYLPIQFLSWLGVDYTLSVAAALQSAHVAIGAIGVILLGRTLGLGWAAATLAGLMYHFGSIFYSNQQHADIIRGAALLPFVLHAFHPSNILRSRLFLVWAVVVLWQFLVSAYPGIIVSGGYTSALATLFWAYHLSGRKRLAYLAVSTAAVASAVLLSLVKWGPLLFHGIPSLELSPLIFGIDPRHLLTTFFRYDVPFLPGDVTMQSIWIPPLAIVFFAFLAHLPRHVGLFLLIALLAYVAGLLAWMNAPVRDFIPGLTLSRMQHSDWRPPLHISLALLAAFAWTSITANRQSLEMATVRGMLLIILLALAGCVAMLQGYATRDIGVAVIPLMVLSLVVMLTMPLGSLGAKRAITLTAAVLYAIAAAYVHYAVDVPRTWQMRWSVEHERELFGGSISDLVSERRFAWGRRPARLHFGSGAVPDSLDVRFNRAWYAQDFATFGYDNLKMREWLTFQAAVADPVGGASLLAFMKKPSQGIALLPEATFDYDFAAQCPVERFACGELPEFDAEMLAFVLDGASIEVTTSMDVWLVENELWYPGWQGKLCDTVGSCRLLKSVPSEANLRMWWIPEGVWSLTTVYRPPGRRVFFSLLLVGLGLLAVTSAYAYRPWRKNHESV